MKKLIIILTLFSASIKAQSTKDSLILIDRSDVPENVGQSQKCESPYIFFTERKDIFKSFVYSPDKKYDYFIKPFVADSISTQGRCILFEVPKDFEN